MRSLPIMINKLGEGQHPHNTRLKGQDGETQTFQLFPIEIAIP